MNNMNGNLVLKRRQDQWTYFTDRDTGKTFRIRVCKITINSVNLVIEDPGNQYKVEREERLTPYGVRNGT
jgi:hypothetical protein